ncbi:hypothetical protein [Streptomyces sp. NBC_00724]|nr:hypothetical protein OHB17_42400 [Streptomyces sp. NBC_00724]
MSNNECELVGGLVACPPCTLDELPSVLISVAFVRKVVLTELFFE